MRQNKHHKPITLCLIIPIHLLTLPTVSYYLHKCSFSRNYSRYTLENQHSVLYSTFPIFIIWKVIKHHYYIYSYQAPFHSITTQLIWLKAKSYHIFVSSYTYYHTTVFIVLYDKIICIHLCWCMHSVYCANSVCTELYTALY